MPITAYRSLATDYMRDARRSRAHEREVGPLDPETAVSGLEQTLNRRSRRGHLVGRRELGHAVKLHAQDADVQTVFDDRAQHGVLRALDVHLEQIDRRVMVGLQRLLQTLRRDLDLSVRAANGRDAVRDAVLPDGDMKTNGLLPVPDGVFRQ